MKQILQKRRKIIKGAKKVMILFLGLGLIWTLIPALKTTVASEEVIELKYGTQYPPTHSYSIADQHWIEKIEKETNGRVKIKSYWAGTLIGNINNMGDVAKGIVDIGFITPVFEKSGVDLTKALIGYFWGSPSDRLNMKIFWELWDKFPELQKELERVKLLAITGASPMRLMSVKPVRTLADLKGMRIKTSSDMVVPLKEYGADGLEISMAETYEGLKKGTLDGVFAPLEGYKSMKLAEVVKYETENFCAIRGPNRARGMNWDTWNKLPPSIQKIFEANKEWWSVEILNVIDKLDVEGKELASKAGVQVIQLPASEVEKFEALHEVENVKTAKELDQKGLPATKLYNETRRLIKAYGTTK
jgi:TRAP-type C4-dicarboxylate transport system substrate-binding protein